MVRECVAKFENDLEFAERSRSLQKRVPRRQRKAVCTCVCFASLTLLLFISNKRPIVPTITIEVGF